VRRQTGEQAISLYQDTRPDSACSWTSRCPVCDGLTALRRSGRSTSRAGDHLLRARPAASFIVQAIQLGAKDFIVKPFQPQRVVSALKKRPSMIHVMMNLKPSLWRPVSSSRRLPSFWQEVTPPGGSLGAAAAAAARSTPLLPLRRTGETRLTLAEGHCHRCAVGRSRCSRPPGPPLPTTPTWRTSLPLLLKGRVRRIGFHAYLQEEADTARRALIEREVALTEKSLTGLRKETRRHCSSKQGRGG